MSLFAPENRIMKLLSAVLVCAFAALEAAPLAAVEAGGGAPSNFDVLQEISENAADEVVALVSGVPPGTFVRLTKSKGVGDVDFIIENAFVERMRAAGYRIRTDANDVSSGDSALYTLSYQVVRLAVRYPRISRRWWFGSKEVVREARADVVAQFIDRRTGDVLWIREGSGAYDDVIPYSLLSTVEEKQYEFTRPPRSEFKMSRIVEPVIVAGIVVGLVFLFFSNQSNE